MSVPMPVMMSIIVTLRVSTRCCHGMTTCPEGMVIQPSSSGGLMTTAS